MTKIITAIDNPDLNEEIKKEKNVEIICKDIQYKEGILEILEKNSEIDYILIEEKLPGEIELNNLIDKIIEINKKIRIIITIKKENINNINIKNNKIIKIIYENKLNLDKLKNNENIKIQNKKSNIKNKNKETEIIAIIGNEKVGKSMTILNLSYNIKNKKILIVDLNNKEKNINNILEYKKINKNKVVIKKEKIELKKNYRKINQKYKQRNINEKIINKIIIEIKKNLHLIPYKKLINLKTINKIKENYDLIFIEVDLNKNKLKNKIINNKIIKKIIIIKPNLIEIKNTKKIIEKNRINNYKIIINNYNKYSIDEKIIKEMFYPNKIIGKIKYENKYDELINKKFKSYNEKIKIEKSEIFSIINKRI